MTIRSIVAVSIVVSACATAPAAPQPAAEKENPVPRTPGQPVKLDILGASYTFPARFDLPDFADKPGVYGLRAVDRITACEMNFNFETIADGKLVTQYTNDQVAQKDQELSTNKTVKTEVITKPFKVLGNEGRVIRRTTTAVDNASDHYFLWQFDVWVPDQTLAVHGFAQCPDEALLDKTFSELINTINTQARAQ